MQEWPLVHIGTILVGAGPARNSKKCHLERRNEQILPPQAVVRQARAAGAWKTCLHPHAGPKACSKIIAAHTVQRTRTLGRLIDATNHVLTFYPYEPDADGLMPKLHRRGWREASTFAGFCSTHDDATFAVVEKGDGTLTVSGAFALSYRALCHELYQKVRVQRAEAHARTLADRGLAPRDQRNIQHAYDVRAAGRAKAITQLLSLKTRADYELMSGDHRGWHFVVLSFEGPLCFATAGLTTPTWDLRERPLQVLHNPDSELEYLHLSVAGSTDNDVAVVFGWRIEHTAPEMLVESLVSRRPDDVGSYIAQYVFAHLENVYFNAAWWSTLSTSDQRHMRELAAHGNPYYKLPRYTTSRLVPWVFKGTVGFIGRNA